ncbi:mechanosensitive ion channel family protein [Francisella tularensis]|uniref:mechanosensitive ion channel family protein n=1 Tax=Francisella tularensis TaxID=263 RepID=UPI000515C81F|nr:mechanosensitive ion channel domain-containing protein [Francisella tularensis]AKH92454.1 mechanosensitive ion channel protein MscS [Francisella tularensis subsp. tularensis WY-00W4114]MBK2015785.1 mechanosensitive ion channel [Francisella tularensis subsp. tularensis]MBK2017217.1 mechanosensitive ion channel [Francisella tularensis subsp. tularensis]MBK2019199.1 mechanosensitive ion channel [Francisella tularensis subsp. tularensis]MBK2024501.1 mechanosensitive ion channel [Francisella tul
MNLLNNILLRVENYSTTYILLIDFVICLVLSVIISLLGSLLVIKHKDTIRYSFVKSFKLTLYLVIWSYFIKTCVDLPVIVHLPDYKEVIVSYSDKIFDFCIYLAIIISLFRFLYKSKNIAIEKKKAVTKDGYDDFRDINAIFKALELGAIVVSVILILAAFRVPLTALGAFSGVALAGLTLSQSTLLTNLFGGLFVVFNRKYSEGDIISSEINSTIKFSGTIKKIGTLTTRVDNSETAPMHIPNSVFLNTCITTTSRRTHRRIVQFITIDYKHIDKIPVIKQKLLEILKSHPNIDQNKTLAVSLASGGTNISGKLEGSFGSSGINIQIYAMVNKVFFSDFINVQDEIFINIAKELNDLDIEFAINQVTLHKY